MSPLDDINQADDASDSEIARYEKAFRATRQSLDEAIRNLSVLAELETNFARRSQLEATVVQLKGEFDDLERAGIAFHAHTAVMVPPSAEQVAELISLASAASQLTVQRATAAASIKIATSALKKFAEIQEIGEIDIQEEEDEEEGGSNGGAEAKM